MIDRTLFSIAFDPEWGRQMRFITGPRQSGKTTLAKLQLNNQNSEKLYYLWDLKGVRDRYRESELFFTKDSPPLKDIKQWVCFDEIHKIHKWKNILKGIYDATEDNYQFIVTSSAKFNMTKRAGDSLSGRYFTFHLYPLTLKEVTGRPHLNTPDFANPMDFVLRQLEGSGQENGPLDNLLHYGGFPEPFTRQSQAFQKKWSHAYLDRVIHEDIATLTHIIDRDKLYDLYLLLPEMVGNPLSENSMATHLETNPPTIKNYLKRLEDFYLSFHITPYSKNIKRSLMKASKWYLYDWTKIDHPAKRFENFVAVELQTMLKMWMEMTGGDYALFYIRDKEKRETAFLIVKEKNPWLLVEVKLSDAPVENHHEIKSRALGDIPIVQICHEKGIALQQKKNIFRISASKFFS